MAGEAETLNCPMCGASASSDATKCEHCGARLATVACPSCFGMVFAGSKFCSHCGAAIARMEIPTEIKERCPRCQVNLESVLVGKTNLLECPKCEGIWTDTASLQQICIDREQQSAVLGAAAPLPGDGDIEQNIRYLPCPVCRKLMNRVNFAHCSHVIVDVCREHGTWFDKDELRRIVEFIRGGGMEISRAEQIVELERRRRALASQQVAAAREPMPFSGRRNYDELHGGIASVAANLFTSFLGLD